MSWTPMLKRGWWRERAEDPLPRRELERVGGMVERTERA